MTREEMIATVDGEIARLEQIRALLAASTSERFTTAGALAPAAGSKATRTLSADARRRIALGQKRRWAKVRREPVTA